MNFRTCAAIAVLPFLFVAAVMAQIPPASCQFQLLDFPGAQSTEASGINNFGVVVGAYVVRAPARSGFVFHQGQYVTYNVPGSNSTSLFGINNLGWIVGSYRDQSLHSHGFLLRNRQLIKFDVPRAQETIATGINDAGIIVGSFFDGTNNHGFVKIGGIFITLNYPGSTSTVATGINNHGSIVGSFTSATGGGGFLYQNGRFMGVNAPSEGSSTSPAGISISGEIVGQYMEQTVLPHIPRGFIDQSNRFKSVIFGQDQGTFLKGINGSGMIVGTYHQNSPEDFAFRSFVASNCK
jgi:probable HAF family extracellular repeat protein